MVYNIFNEQGTYVGEVEGESEDHALRVFLSLTGDLFVDVPLTSRLKTDRRRSKRKFNRLR